MPNLSPPPTEAVEQIAAAIAADSRRIGDEYIYAIGAIRAYVGAHNPSSLDDTARMQRIRDVLAGLDLALDRKARR